MASWKVWCSGNSATSAHLPAQQREAEQFVRAKGKDIMRKWNDYFVLHKQVAPERITKRINR